MPAGTLTLRDDFTRADGALTTGYGPLAVESGTIARVISNQCGTTGANQGFTRTAESLGANQGVRFDIVQDTSTVYGVWLRGTNLQTGGVGSQAYVVYIERSSGSVFLFVWDGSTYTQIGPTITGVTIAIGSVVQVEINTWSVTVYDDSVLVATLPEPNHYIASGGQIAVDFYVSTQRIDNLYTGTLSTTFTQTVTATTTFTGLVSRQPRKTLSSTTTFTATVVRRGQLVKAGATTFTAAITNRAVTKTIVATTTFSGTFIRQARHTVAATTTFTATASALLVKTLLVTASTTFSAAVQIATFPATAARQIVSGRRVGTVQPDDSKNVGGKTRK